MYGAHTLYKHICMCLFVYILTMCIYSYVLHIIVYLCVICIYETGTRRVSLQLISPLCRSFFADVRDHSRPPRSVMIVTKPSDRGLNSRSLSVQDCLYDLRTTAVRHWYDGSVWSALSTFSTTISTTTDTIDTTTLTMLTTTPTLLPMCYHD